MYWFSVFFLLLPNACDEWSSAIYLYLVLPPNCILFTVVLGCSENGWYAPASVWYYQYVGILCTYFIFAVSVLLGGPRTDDARLLAFCISSMLVFYVRILCACFVFAAAVVWGGLRMDDLRLFTFCISSMLVFHECVLYLQHLYY